MKFLKKASFSVKSYQDASYFLLFALGGGSIAIAIVIQIDTHR